MTTLIELRKLAAKKGIGVEYDLDCQCYRATAPPGQCFEPGLHEHIAVFGSGFIGNGLTHAEARDNLRLDIEETTLEPCTNAQCDWCHPDD